MRGKKKALAKRRPSTRKERRAQAQPRGDNEKPLYWELRVLAAHHFDLIEDATDEKVGAAVGRTRETINDWRHHPTWPEAVAESRVRWKIRFRAEMNVAVDNGLLFHARKRNAQILTWWKERTDPEFTPRTKSEVTGKDGGPIETKRSHEELSDIELAALAARLAAELAKV